MSGCKAWTPVNPTEKTWTDLRICAQVLRFMFKTTFAAKSAQGVIAGINKMIMSSVTKSQFNIYGLGTTILVSEAAMSSQNVFGLGEKIIVEEVELSDDMKEEIIITEAAMSSQEVFGLGEKIIVESVG